MSDLIDRQAAIDAINKAFERVFKWDGTEPLGEKVLKDVPSAQPEQRWIPCSERLPEMEVEVLIRTTRYHPKTSIGWITSNSYGNKHWEWIHFPADHKAHCPTDITTICPGDEYVIAWTPLPEPYREEGE